MSGNLRLSHNKSQQKSKEKENLKNTTFSLIELLVRSRAVIGILCLGYKKADIPSPSTDSNFQYKLRTITTREDSLLSDTEILILLLTVGRIKDTNGAQRAEKMKSFANVSLVASYKVLARPDRFLEGVALN